MQGTERCHQTGESSTTPDAAAIERILAEAESACRSRGTRLTTKRQSVLRGLLQSGRALSAYELADYCKETLQQALPPMSVYRMLEFLEEEQLVHKLDTTNKYIACSHITCAHDHGVPQFLICFSCRRVKEIRLDRELTDKLLDTVSKAGFQFASPKFELNCLCNNCASNTR